MSKFTKTDYIQIALQKGKPCLTRDGLINPVKFSNIDLSKIKPVSESVFRLKIDR